MKFKRCAPWCHLTYPPECNAEKFPCKLCTNIWLYLGGGERCGGDKPEAYKSLFMYILCIFKYFVYLDIFRGNLINVQKIKHTFSLMETCDVLKILGGGRLVISPKKTPLQSHVWKKGRHPHLKPSLAAPVDNRSHSLL